ncbi:hypothetical protein GOM71_17120 [Paenibacillus sp. NEAU-GSW1]|nr:hypothetical protein [Paenibacillus sp. NEAU-GSW1]
MEKEEEEQFYCVGCDKMVPSKQAYDLFRTGFFRVVYPLGCCVECNGKQPNSAQQDITLAI